MYNKKMTGNQKTGNLPAGTKVPNHIAMILDGNRRWARARGLQPWEGHKAGYEAIRKVAKESRRLGVHTFTVWAFSTENWDRPKQEIEAIFDLFRLALTEAEKEAHEEKVRIIHLGRKDRLPEDVRKRFAELEESTKDYTNNVFNLAIDYGGRDEILRATQKIINAHLAADQLDEESFAKYLDTYDQPYPYVDLFIRTSGEQRTSGLLPWQMTYAEMYWEQDHLPDFTIEKLAEAIKDYSRRRRRFGGNDKEEHLKFDPKLVAKLELDWRRELDLGESTRLRDLVTAYVKEQYGLSKELAVTAGTHLAKALVCGEQEDWKTAKESLKSLYTVVKGNLGLAFEPEIIANFEIKLWQNKANEEDMKALIAEKYRFSHFQATRSAHLAWLANLELEKHNWDKARGYMEQYYAALKERVA